MNIPVKRPGWLAFPLACLLALVGTAKAATVPALLGQVDLKGKIESILVTPDGKRAVARLSYAPGAVGSLAVVDMADPAHPALRYQVPAAPSLKFGLSDDGATLLTAVAPEVGNGFESTKPANYQVIALDLKSAAKPVQLWRRDVRDAHVFVASDASAYAVGERIPGIKDGAKDITPAKAVNARISGPDNWWHMTVTWLDTTRAPVSWDVNRKMIMLGFEALLSREGNFFLDKGAGGAIELRGPSAHGLDEILSTTRLTPLVQFEGGMILAEGMSGQLYLRDALSGTKGRKWTPAGTLLRSWTGTAAGVTPNRAIVYLPACPWCLLDVNLDDAKKQNVKPLASPPHAFMLGADAVQHLYAVYGSGRHILAIYDESHQLPFAPNWSEMENAHRDAMIALTNKANGARLKTAQTIFADAKPWLALDAKPDPALVRQVAGMFDDFYSLYAIENNRDDPSGARVLRLSGNVPEAMLRQAIALDPQSAPAHYHLADLLMEQANAECNTASQAALRKQAAAEYAKGDSLVTSRDGARMPLPISEDQCIPLPSPKQDVQ